MYQFNDGGREAAGYKGFVNDCVVRSIAIAADLPYQEVYDEMVRRNKEFAETSRSRKAKIIKAKNGTPTRGNIREVYEPYLLSLGFSYVSTMGIGTGCKVHLRADELPKGRLVVRVSKHMTAMIDGVIHDTWDPRRETGRCVYGYYIKTC